ARPAPGLPHVRRGVARAEDGRLTRPGALLPRRSRAPRASVRREGRGGAAPVREERARPREARVVGRRLCIGEAAREALFVLRSGSESVLSRGSGGAGPLPGGRDALWRAHRAEQSAHLARGCALL